MSLVEKAIRKMQETARAPGVETVAPAPARPSIPRAAAAALAPALAPRSHARELPDGEALPPARVLQLDLPQLRNGGLLPPVHQERQIGQQYRQIKRPLIANAIGRGGEPLPGGQLVMVASAMPGEGKTFTTVNLALSLSTERDLHVLLVDADVAKPHISKLLGVENEPGLLDLLRDPELDPEGLVLATSVPGLSVLPAGQHSDDATELLSSGRMQEVVSWLAARDPRRIAIFDSPPLLLATESHALAAQMGQVVVVVKAGVTIQSQLNDALDFVRDRPFVALVLNQSTSATASAYYHYYGDAPQSSPA